MPDFSKYMDEEVGTAPEELVLPIGTYTGQVAGEARAIETGKGGVMIAIPLKVIGAEDDVDTDLLPGGVLPSGQREDATFLVSEDFGKRQRDEFFNATGIDWKGLSTREAATAAQGATLRFYVNKHRELNNGQKAINISKYMSAE